MSDSLHSHRVAVGNRRLKQIHEILEVCIEVLWLD